MTSMTSTIPCDEAACVATQHSIDPSAPESQPFHEATPIQDDLFSVRVTKYGDDEWLLDIDAETLSAEDSVRLADAIVRQATVANRLNTKQDSEGAPNDED